MNKYNFGLDIGTSSIKALGFCGENKIFIRKSYEEKSCEHYLKLIKEIIDEIIEKTSNNIDSICFSSQTGTYVVDDQFLINWNDNVGQNELSTVLKTISDKEFVKEIQMSHPQLISYPLPKLLYIKNNYKKSAKVAQLKDFIVYSLTGKNVSDYYTWRGLYNFEKKSLSTYLLNKFSLNFTLPEIVSPDTVVGTYKGINIVVGLNDYFSALIGIGAINNDSYFDITGTSEHIGFISDSRKNYAISSPFLNNFVTYGVTKSCGVAINFINNLFPNMTSSMDVLNNNPPIFLPYLNGERAPIYDVNARGLFFNITDKCTFKEMIYSVYEGVAFTLLDNLSSTNFNELIVAGGAASITLLNQIKSNLLNCDILIPNQVESSAYGAYLISKYGLDLDSIKDEISYSKLSLNRENAYNEKLLKRFNIFKQLYKTNKNNFEQIKEAI